MERKFIEGPNFPINIVNEQSAKEKSGGRPDFWEMVFWWTRKPLAGARAVIAGALLPHTVKPIDFVYNLRLSDEGVTHRKSPYVPPSWREVFKGKKLLDPFAGFGSIPLEAIRLGLEEVVAVELLPTAYVFLKAVLEIPKWATDNGLGSKLIDDVRKWGEWVIEELRKDPDVSELYDDDVAVYIGSWEVKCPHCSRYTPLVGNWWLARVSRGEASDEEETLGKKVFSRLAWMTPKVLDGEVYVEVVDINEELEKNTIEVRVSTRQGIVEVQRKRYQVPAPNIDAKKELATCLICGNTISSKGRKEEWYIKQALREWNQNLERYLTGEITLKQLTESKARPRLLVKVRASDKNLKFKPTTKEDNEKIWKALEKLKQIWGDPDIPTEDLWKYHMGTAGQLSIWVWGYDKFYKLFNPRQLLILVKLVKLIREAGKKIEEEKLKQGWDKQKAHKHAEAVTTYLAIALVRYATFTSLVSPVRADTIMGAIAAGSLTFRGIAMVWNWCELLLTASITGSFDKNLNTVVNAIKYLVNAVSGSSSRVDVMLDDAAVLSKLGEKKFDLIVTDPPYRDDIAYAELSDFYYVWLKRVLSDVREVGGVCVRVPRFYPEAFFDDVGNEVEVQWRVFAPKEVSEVEGRAKFFGGLVGTFDYFKDLLSRSFQAMVSRLSEGGVIITYYAHTSPDAWEALLEAGWRVAGMRITSAHAVATESAQRVTARGSLSLDMSIVAVWRGRAEGRVLVDEVYVKAVDACRDDVLKYMSAGYRGVNLFVSILGCVLSHFTQYRDVVGVKSLEDLVKNYIYLAVAESIAKALGAEATAKLSPQSMFYLLSKVLIDRGPRQVRRSIDRSTLNILAIGTRSSVDQLKSLKLIEIEGDKATLMEPPAGRDVSESLRRLIHDRDLSPSTPTCRCSIDALHLMELWAVSLPKDEFRSRVTSLRSKYLHLVEDAVGLARIIAGSAVIAENDPEKIACTRILEALDLKPVKGLDLYMRK